MPENLQTFDLVFEGGGAKGTVFVGALEEFYGRGKKARRYVGTSAGAITAALLAAGYTPEELKALAQAKIDGKPEFSTFMDIAGSFDDDDIGDSLTMQLFRAIDIPVAWDSLEETIDRFLIGRLMKIAAYRELFSFVECGGLYAGEAFTAWIRERLAAKLGSDGVESFAAFHEKTKSDLSVVACDTAGKRRLVLNHRTAPDCPVFMGVRMSMSIPFVWQEVEWRRAWGTYLGDDMTGHTIVDGGALSNFPLDLVVSSDRDVVKVMGPTDPNAAGTIGLLIDESTWVAGLQKADEIEPAGDAEGLLGIPQRLKTIKRISRLVSTMMEAHDKQAIGGYPELVCKLPAGGVGTIEFDMTDAKMGKLIDSGRVAMKAYLDKIGA